MGPLLMLLGMSFIHGILLFVMYISNTNAFPEQLSLEDEKKLIARMEKGDKCARNILIERNLRLVAHVVKKFDNKRMNIEDFISIGSIGLIKAIETFDRSKKTRLGTYAAKCIENEILMHLRATKKLKNEVYLYDPIDSDSEGNEICLIDIMTDKEGDVVGEEVESIIEKQELYKKLNVLSRRERSVVEMRYGLTDGIKKTQREISEKLGISRSYVSRIEKKALDKIHQELFAEGYI